MAIGHRSKIEPTDKITAHGLEINKQPILQRVETPNSPKYGLLDHVQRTGAQCSHRINSVIRSHGTTTGSGGNDAGGLTIEGAVPHQLRGLKHSIKTGDSPSSIV